MTEAGNSSLNGMIEKILSKYSQSKREIADQKTFADIFLEYYENKFGQPYNHPGKKRPMERSVCAAYKNSSVLHNESFRNLTANTLQSVVDDCPLKHASLEPVSYTHLSVGGFSAIWSRPDIASRRWSLLSLIVLASFVVL